MLQLTRARNRLTTPATLTLPEIAASGLTVRTSDIPGPKRNVPAGEPSRWEIWAWAVFRVEFLASSLHPASNMSASGFQPSSPRRLWGHLGSLWCPGLWGSTWEQGWGPPPPGNSTPCSGAA